MYFLDTLWYNYIHNRPPIASATAPVLIPKKANQEDCVMHTNTTPVFSSFRKLKHTNPETYYSARTAKEMILAQKKLGSAFYDLSKKE